MYLTMGSQQMFNIETHNKFENACAVAIACIEDALRSIKIKCHLSGQSTRLDEAKAESEVISLDSCKKIAYNGKSFKISKRYIRYCADGTVVQSDCASLPLEKWEACDSCCKIE